MELNSGFAILKRYEVTFRQAIESRAFHRDGIVGPVYAVPLGNDPVPAPEAPRYRGLDRYPVPHMYPEMGDWFLTFLDGDPELIEAARALGGIFIRIAGDDDLWISRQWMETVDDARQVWNLMGKRNQDFEVIFARPCGDPAPVPESCTFLGCDASDPVPGGFSCINDALFFPQWHGTDPEGVLFAEHFARLNEHGLFDTHDEAFEYLRYYLSFDWTERSQLFTSMEIYALDMAPLE